jgi:glutaredoxin
MDTAVSQLPLQTNDLVLYKFNGCPYCQKVLRAIHRLGVSVRLRDTDEDPTAWGDLLRLGGVEQVPCLVIDGKPMYESDDIVAYLERLTRGG